MTTNTMKKLVSLIVVLAMLLASCIANAEAEEALNENASQTITQEAPEADDKAHDDIEELLNAGIVNALYRTANGKKFHVHPRCVGNKPDRSEASLAECIEAGLTPCKKCCKHWYLRQEIDETGAVLGATLVRDNLVPETVEDETWIYVFAKTVVYTDCNGNMKLLRSR